MSIRSFKTSSIKTGEKRSKFWDQTTLLFDSDYELISTTVLGSDTASVTFDNLGNYSSTYKHLQIRYAARHSISAGLRTLLSRFNGDTASNYRGHYLVGTGSSVLSGDSGSTTSSYAGALTGNDATANSFSAGVIDLLDPYSTSKFKTTRSLSGATSETRVDFLSGLWRSTDSLTSWQLFSSEGNFKTGSRFSLYGVK